MPQYGFGAFQDLAAIDARNKEIWETRDFEVKELGDFHAFAFGLGAAHCITKYLGRELETA